jgi:iron complex transport system ATP-binding protein
MILEARGLRFRYPGIDQLAVDGVDLSVSRGEVLGIVGPNGSGKTTLLRLLLGMLTPVEGSVTLAGRDIRAWTRSDLARTVGAVVQREEPAFPLRVRQAVQLGRYPHVSRLGGFRSEDHAAVKQAMKECDIEHLSDRWVTTLSGGEWQRVRIARALAQQPRALVLDEATANLDVRHEMEVFELAADLATRNGLGVLMITHHVNLAARFVNQMVVLNAGRTAATGTPAQALRQDVLEEVFDWPLQTFDWHGVPQLMPLKKSERNEA